MARSDGTKLHGGRDKDFEPVKIDNTVHRQLAENSAFVHKALKFLERSGFDWAPRYLGMDEQGREVLEYIDGYVPHGQEVPPATWSLRTMQEIFRRIRVLHDITATSQLSGSQECICHGDLSYANTVYRDGRAVAFIDWDWAHPGQRIDDVAYAVLQYLSIGEFENASGPAERAQLAGELADTYGLDATARSKLVDRMLGLLIETRSKQLSDIEAGRPSALRLAEAGVPERMLKRHEWLLRNRRHFELVLGS